jgi:hypothetical protein
MCKIYCANILTTQYLENPLLDSYTSNFVDSNILESRWPQLILRLKGQRSRGQTWHMNILTSLLNILIILCLTDFKLCRLVHCEKLMTTIDFEVKVDIWIYWPLIILRTLSLKDIKHLNELITSMGFEVNASRVKLDIKYWPLNILIILCLRTSNFAH